MQLGMIGLGRMGSGMVQRLLKQGQQCVVYDAQAPAVERLQDAGASGARSLLELVERLARPRAIWLMLPAVVVDQTLARLVPLLSLDDIVIDGGNSHFHDDIRRGKELRAAGIHYLDVGTSGGIAGIERGYCLMVGGEFTTFQHVRPVFSALAPGVSAAHRTPGRDATISDSEQGFLHCGPVGAGHFVKMVHNGIEYGIMAAYAEGLNILRNANVGTQAHEHSAQTAPLRHPEFYQYAMNLPDIAEVWRRGSVIGSWLLDLTAMALQEDPELAGYGGRVSDSGEGRWTIQTAIDESVPTPTLSAALQDRFTSRGKADFAYKIVSAMRREFGGHVEKKGDVSK